ncbi:MAG: hypothetical protein GY926_16420 [bacterium]|nr:hypothetical protein [bacterium]
MSQNHGVETPRDLAIPKCPTTPNDANAKPSGNGKRLLCSATPATKTTPSLRVAVCGPSDLDGRRTLSVDSERLGLAVPHLAASFEDFADLLGSSDNKQHVTTRAVQDWC